MNFKAIAGLAPNLKRGNIVKVKGKRAPQMVVQANWQRGVKLVPYTGSIASRPLARKQIENDRRAGRVHRTVVNPGDWFPFTAITHYAAR